MFSSTLSLFAGLLGIAADPAPATVNQPPTPTITKSDWFAFGHLPDVLPVPDPTDLAVQDFSKDSHPPRLRYDFPNAARFPDIHHDQRGQRLDLSGVTIYEGMRFAIDPANQKRYDVSFTVTIPQRPITLYLQVMIATDREPIRLTLPPIQIEPKVNDILRLQQNTFNVRVTGNSTLLAERRKDVLTAIECNKIFRDGVARFGSYRPESLFP